MIGRLVTLALFLTVSHSVPQDLVFDVADLIDVGNRGSFGTIVTPVPNAATIRPQVTNTAEGPTCYCVPYHDCHQNQRSTDKNTNQKIEISFYNGTCEHFLDVCCGDEGQPAQPSQPPPAPLPQPNQGDVFPQPIPPQPPVTPETSQPYRQQGCGVRNVGGIDFSVNDIDTSKYSGFGEFPWTVAIIDMQTDICECAGSLIHPSVVLTASHCVKPQQVGVLKVRAGEWDTQTSKERLPFQERIVGQIVQHPNYNIRALHYDVAILTLEAPFTLDQHIGLICLPPLNYVPDRRDCFAAGWGKDKFGKEGAYSVIMKKVPLPIVDFKECQSRLRQTRLSSKFVLHPSFTCAGGELGTDTCEGDGGAPLACPHVVGGETRYIQSGIVAWGIGCNTEVPAVYANVRYVREWIDKTVQRLGYVID